MSSGVLSFVFPFYYFLLFASSCTIFLPSFLTFLLSFCYIWQSWLRTTHSCALSASSFITCPTKMFLVAPGLFEQSLASLLVSLVAQG